MDCDYGMAFNPQTKACEYCNYLDDLYYLDKSCVKKGSKDCEFQMLKGSVFECVLGCEYGQYLFNKSTCINIDTSQGDFVDFDACDFAGTTEIWNRQFYCRVENSIGDLTVNIEQLNEFADCNFASLDMGHGTLINAVIFMNVSFLTPSKCQIGVNISLFVNAKPV